MSNQKKVTNQNIMSILAYSFKPTQQKSRVYGKLQYKRLVDRISLDNILTSN